MSARRKVAHSVSFERTAVRFEGHNAIGVRLVLSRDAEPERDLTLDLSTEEAEWLGRKLLGMAQVARDRA